jgi:hypothetical protein
MEGSIAFPLSVKAAEPAICAWAALFADATGAPLPPLPVMVAALLRRPQLDVFIAAVAAPRRNRNVWTRSNGPTTPYWRHESASDWCGDMTLLVSVSG